jgi:hypothetical protein
VELVVDKMTLVLLLVVAYSLFLPFIVPVMFPALLNVPCVFIVSFRFCNSLVLKFIVLCFI